MAYGYGVSYRGSKSRLAERIVAALPPAAHFYDLFCGGCAVAHAALLSGKWRHVHLNDRDPRGPRLFLDAIAGRYRDETRFISRPQFFAERDVDAYVALVWSFASGTENYIYGVEVEPQKVAMHRALVFGDLAPLAEWPEYLPQVAAAVRGASDYRRRLEMLSPQSLDNRANRGSAYRMPHLDKLLRMQRLERLATFQRRLSLTIGNYADVAIERDAVIYCDIPYRGTEAQYKEFDHERFYDWAEAQRAPVFVSEYEMPGDRFAVCQEWKHTATCSATATLRVTERLYRPRSQWSPPSREVYAPLFA